MGGGKSSAPAAPDYTPIAAASEAAARVQAEVAREQLAWAKEQYASDKAVSDKILAVALPAMESEAQAGKDLRERYNTVFQPIEDQLIAEAKDYASPERIESEAARAQADVTQAFDTQRRNALQRLESYGVDPSQTRSAALDRGARIAQGAATAAAANQSRINTENTGRALRGEAINIGKGLPSNIAAAYGTAQAAGQSGLQGALNTTLTGAQTMGTAPQWSGLQNQSLNSWTNALNSGYQNQIAGYNAQNNASSGWGQVLGTVAGVGTRYLLGAAGLADGGPAPDDFQGMTIDSTAEDVTPRGALAGPLPRDARDPQGKKDGFLVRLAGDEFVIPASVMKRKGTDWAERMIQQFGDEGDRAASEKRMQTGAAGGRPVRQRGALSPVALEGAA